MPPPIGSLKPESEIKRQQPAAPFQISGCRTILAQVSGCPTFWQPTLFLI
ncbi:hypothetical protein [Kingella oralis]|uniref:Uncharacterized protein n=1 Tax=Kingella oralis ATCC 51147 TaxID=629741 RepID=C4GIK6_9NEIS|nr:hypothetical protein [Kingella oralis]EEP67628.1 hypothetical protein GCWU000324_01877 [Kingella oralis ATCC 51147]QMT43504.1 hypothetical protein H3L93_03965 [Kingella oralis]